MHILSLDIGQYVPPGEVPNGFKAKGRKLYQRVCENISQKPHILYSLILQTCKPSREQGLERAGFLNGMEKQLRVHFSVSALQQPAQVGARDSTKFRGNALRHLPVRGEYWTMSFLKNNNSTI